MSDDVQTMLAVTLVAIVVLTGIIFIFLGVKNATNKVNTRLDHIGTACAKAGNVWLNNNCLPITRPTPTK